MLFTPLPASDYSQIPWTQIPLPASDYSQILLLSDPNLFR